MLSKTKKSISLTSFSYYEPCGDNEKIMGIDSKIKSIVSCDIFEKSKKVKPFEINKIGFGMISAWLSVENIDRIKI